jgi:hypothetical protein
MADSFSKKQQHKKKVLKQKEKDQKKADRKLHNNKGKGFDSMLIYVDENGHFTDTKPLKIEDKKEVKKESNS